MSVGKLGQHLVRFVTKFKYISDDGKWFWSWGKLTGYCCASSWDGMKRLNYGPAEA